MPLSNLLDLDIGALTRFGSQRHAMNHAGQTTKKQDTRGDVIDLSSDDKGEQTSSRANSSVSREDKKSRISLDREQVGLHHQANSNKTSGATENRFASQFNQYDRSTPGTFPSDVSQLPAQLDVPRNSMGNVHRIGYDPVGLNVRNSLPDISPCYAHPQSYAEHEHQIKGYDTQYCKQPQVAQQLANHVDIKLLRRENEEFQRCIQDAQREISDLKQDKEHHIMELKKLEIKEEEIRHENHKLHISFETLKSTLRKERNEREEIDVQHRSEMVALVRQHQIEKEHVQKLKNMYAQMVQSADSYKLDNSYFESTLMSLRFQIRNWVRNLELPISTPGTVDSSESKGPQPNYEFLDQVIPFWATYTRTKESLRNLVQAYVWKQIVVVIFQNDFWVSIDKSLDSTDDGLDLREGYHLLKRAFDTSANPTREETSKYHQWRSDTARLLMKQTQADRILSTARVIRDHILSPILSSVNISQENTDIEELDLIVNDAMNLGADAAQQRAYYRLQFIRRDDYGRARVAPDSMTHVGGDEIDQSSQDVESMVTLMVTPILDKFGSSEGANFETYTVLMKAEVCLLPIEKHSSAYSS